MFVIIVDVGTMRLSLIIFISFFSCVFAGFAQDKVIELQPVTKSENLDRDGKKIYRV